MNVFKWGKSRMLDDFSRDNDPGIQAQAV